MTKIIELKNKLKKTFIFIFAIKTANLIYNNINKNAIIYIVYLYR